MSDYFDLAIQQVEKQQMDNDSDTCLRRAMVFALLDISKELAEIRAELWALLTKDQK